MGNNARDRVPSRATAAAWPPLWLRSGTAADTTAGAVETASQPAGELEAQPPGTCRKCGCAIGWRLSDNERVACAACHERPAGCAKLLFVDAAAGGSGAWCDYDTERSNHERRNDTGSAQATELASWETAELVNPCPRCGALRIWRDGRERLRCARCSPPRTAARVLRAAARIRQRHGMAVPDGAAEMMRDLERLTTT
jgi:hypothetical protein